MWEILFICFLCLSTDIETALKSINTNPKTAATPRQPHKRLTFPGGRSCDPMTHVLSKIACFLQRRPNSVSNSTTYWLPREWTGTETAWDGGLCPFNDPPLFSHQSSPPLSHTLFTSFPFPLSFCLGITVRLGAGMCVVLLLLVCLNGSGMTLRRASNLHKNSNPPLTNTDPAHFSHLNRRAPPTHGQLLLNKVYKIKSASYQKKEKVSRTHLVTKSKEKNINYNTDFRSIILFFIIIFF